MPGRLRDRGATAAATGRYRPRVTEDPYALAVTAAEELARATGVTYPLAVDPAGRAFDAFGGRGMPTTVLIAADGTVAEVVAGPLDEQLLVERLRSVLGVR